MTRTLESLMAVYIYIYISRLLEKKYNKNNKEDSNKSLKLGFLLLSFYALKIKENKRRGIKTEGEKKE